MRFFSIKILLSFVSSLLSGKATKAHCSLLIAHGSWLVECQKSKDECPIPLVVSPKSFVRRSPSEAHPLSVVRCRRSLAKPPLVVLWTSSLVVQRSHSVAVETKNLPSSIALKRRFCSLATALRCPLSVVRSLAKQSEA